MAEHSSDLRFPHWQQQYQAALIELNHSKLLERVTEAEYAIYQRLQSLEGIPNCESRFAEQLAIEDALASLRLLKREQVDFPLNIPDSRQPRQLQGECYRRIPASRRRE